MSQATASPAVRPSRVCRLWLEIQKNGSRKSYRVRPEADSACLVAYRLLSSEGADYLVGLSADGSCSCECFAAARGECKHVAALKAAGLLPVLLVELCRSLRSKIDSLASELQTAQAEVAALKAPKRRSRSKKPALAS